MLCAEETNGEVSSAAKVQPKRYSDCTIAGTVEQINSDTVLPDTRFKAIPENGRESNSGDITTEWHVDEQDDWFGAVMCSDWVKGSGWDSTKNTGTQTLKLGTKTRKFRIVKKYTQAPVEYMEFINEQINQLQIAWTLDSYVKLTWSFMGSNHPKTVTTDPFSGKTVNSAMTTKAFTSLKGSLYVGDSWDSMTQVRQSPSFNLSINNNLESTGALFEKTSIENSYGDFEVTGDFDVWKADTIARTLSNDAIESKSKYIKISVERESGGKKTTYDIKLIVHLDDSTESKDGSKYKNTIKFTVGSADGLEIVKTVVSV